MNIINNNNDNYKINNVDLKNKSINCIKNNNISLRALNSFYSNKIINQKSIISDINNNLI